jgi:hypothetical protein
MTNRFKSFLDLSKYSLAIGHGTHPEELPPVRVPDNMYIIYGTNPGYLAPLADSVRDYKFLDVFFNRSKTRDFLLHQLPPEQLPYIVTQRNWKWENHIYGPNTMCPNWILQTYDPSDPSFSNVRQQLSFDANKVMGVYKNQSRNRILFGEILTLNDIIRAVNTSNNPQILFLFGCRGDAKSTNYLLNLKNKRNLFGRQYITTPQTYPFKYTEFIHDVMLKEKQAAAEFSRDRYNNRMNTTE